MAHPASRWPALRRRWAGLLGTVLIGLALSPVAAALENVTLQLRWTHGFQFAGYYMAQEKGFYQQAGFDVTFREGGVGIDTVAQVTSGQADFGVGGTNLVLARAAGQPVVILAAIFQHSPYVLIVRKDAGILSPHDLIGRKVMLPPRKRAPEIMAMLLSEGVRLDALEILPLPVTWEDMLNPSIAAFSGYLSNEPFVLQHLKIDYRLLRPQTYGIDFYGDSLFTVDSVIDRDPQRVNAFIEASLKGWRYALNYPYETIALIEARYNPEHRSVAHLRYEYATLKTLIWPKEIPLGQMNHYRWGHIAEIYAVLGLLDSVPDLKGLIYDPKQRALEQQEARQRVLIAVTAITIFGLAALGVWSWTLRSMVRMRTQHLQESNELLSLFIQNSPIFAFIKEVTPTESRVIRASENYLDMIGIPGSQMAGKTMQELFPAEFAAKITADDWAVISKGQILKLDEDLNGRHYITVKFPIIQTHRKLLAGYTIDITDHKLAEEALRRSLDEREVLLREVHHRVKNNLASIVSLIELQQQGVIDPSARDLLTQLGQRVRATALVHEMLYRTESLEQIDFHRYLQALGHSLQDAFSPDGAIRLQTQAPGVWIELDQAIACGLLVNELVTNAFKYAFPQGQPRPGNEQCEIQVTASMEGADYILTVADNGIGLPAGLDWRQVPSLGLVLVRMLGQHQLRGRIDVDCAAGTVFTLRFPAPSTSSA
jgi:two-component sensor histidine kinase/ABC-type nitrate/sulfonate/bicarbonate transport system substrate-binding protein